MKLHSVVLVLLPLASLAQPAVQTRVLAYDHIRDADVFWKKRIWRVVDTRMKQNLPFAYPNAPLAGLMMKGAEEGALVAYDPAYGDDFSKVMTESELIRIFRRIDTVWVPDIYNPDIVVPIVFPREIDPQSITKFRIKEEWIFDEERSEMVVRILGIAPVRDVIDQTTGEIRGESIMFWVNYPESREFFAAHQAFNPYNDFARHTWEDIFEMRFFDSYIVKEDNVYDREIQAYASGIDAVLESERIKMELFKFEHELWNY